MLRNYIQQKYIHCCLTHTRQKKLSDSQTREEKCFSKMATMPSAKCATPWRLLPVFCCYNTPATKTEAAPVRGTIKDYYCLALSSVLVYNTGQRLSPPAVCPSKSFCMQTSFYITHTHTHCLRDTACSTI